MQCICMALDGLAQCGRGKHVCTYSPDIRRTPESSDAASRMFYRSLYFALQSVTPSSEHLLCLNFCPQSYAAEILSKSPARVSTFITDMPPTPPLSLWLANQTQRTPGHTCASSGPMALSRASSFRAVQWSTSRLMSPTTSKRRTPRTRKPSHRLRPNHSTSAYAGHPLSRMCARGIVHRLARVSAARCIGDRPDDVARPDASRVLYSGLPRVRGGFRFDLPELRGR